MADVDQELIAEISRDIVASSAPQELPLFRPSSEAFFKNPASAAKTAAGKDEMLGFGVDGAVGFLTPIVLYVVTDIVKFIADEFKEAVKQESKPAVEAGVKRLFKRFRREPGAEDSKTLNAHQMALVRQRAYEKALQLKVADDKAALLADAIAGSLAAT